MLENSSPSNLLETGSHLFIQYLGIQTCIHSAIYKCHLPYTFCTHAAPYQLTPTSMFHAHHYAVTVVVLTRSTPNMLDPFWFKLIYFGFIWPKECAANIHQPSFFMFLWQSLNLAVFVPFCKAIVFFFGRRPLRLTSCKCPSHCLSSHWNTSLHRSSLCQVRSTCSSVFHCKAA